MQSNFVERDCVITHEGRKFESGGAVVTPEHIRCWDDLQRQGESMSDELFPAPFNLAGEPLRSELDAEGEARVRALAESEARKAQTLLFEPAASPYPNHRRCTDCGTLVFKRNVTTHDCWKSRLSQQWPKSSNLVLRSEGNPHRLPGRHFGD